MYSSAIIKLVLYPSSGLVVLPAWMKSWNGESKCTINVELYKEKTYNVARGSDF